MRCDTPVWLVWIVLLGAGTLQASVMRGELLTLTDLCAVVLWRITEEHEASPGSSSARVAWHFGTYHLVFAIFKWLLDPRGSRASAKMVAYTMGAASTAMVHWFLLPDTADDAMRGAMALVTPWYWCMYTLTGFYLFACLAAYKGVQLLLSYPAAQFASVRAIVLAEPLTPVTALVCAAVALASLANMAFVAMKTKHKLSEFAAHTVRLGRWLLQRHIQFQRGGNLSRGGNDLDRDLDVDLNKDKQD